MLCPKLRVSVIENLSQSAATSLVSELHLFPNPDGSRYITDYYEKIWHNHLASIYVSDSQFKEIILELFPLGKTPRIPRIIVQSVFFTDDTEVRYLNPKVVIELQRFNAITPDGNFFSFVNSRDRKFLFLGFRVVSIHQQAKSSFCDSSFLSCTTTP